MLRTSRCIAGTFLQLGGPDAIFGAVWNPYQFHDSEVSAANFNQPKKFSSASHRPEGMTICKSGQENFATALRAGFSRNAKRSRPKPRGILTAKLVVITN